MSQRSCPITGDVVETAESRERVVVEHPKHGQYVLDADALPALKADAGARARMARWIEEASFLGIGVSNLTVAHVDFFGRLADLEARVSEWHQLRRAIEAEDEERLWRKLRLEWNYNSNHIEGNTLTYHETELLLLYDRVAGGHPMRDYEEMKAHNVAINHARQIANSEQALGEGDVRDLNKILLKEPFYQNAETPDGQPTRKRIVPGRYKTQPNHVRTATGELHRFAEPEETPALMEAWIRDFRRDLSRSAYPLPLFLAESHWSLVRIHPFDDGNGRTARLITNYVLLRQNLPPMVIKSDHRDRYIGALQSADLGQILSLARFMLENVLWSLVVAIRAAKGESIQDPGDLAKEMDVFVRGRKAPEPNQSDLEAVDNVVLLCVHPTIDRLEAEMRPLESLFRWNGHQSSLSGGKGAVSSGSSLFEPTRWESTKATYLVVPGFALDDERMVDLRQEYRFHDYTGRGKQGFDLVVAVAWKLGRRGFGFEAVVDGEPVLQSDTTYAELAGGTPEIEGTTDRLCRAAMQKIEALSQG